MRAMILAAGRGQRLRPLTDTCPKPLLKIAGKALIEYHIQALSQVGIKEIVINVCYLGEQIKKALGSGKKWGVALEYSEEDPVLETGGGIVKALPLLGDTPFLVLSSDIWTDFDFQSLQISDEALAHLVLVDTPGYKQVGDFGLEGNRVVPTKQYTYGNIGLYRPELFKNCPEGVAFPLGELLNKAIKAGQVRGTYFDGLWSNIGTAEDLYQTQASVPLFNPSS